MTDFAYDGPIFLVPLSLSYPSLPVQLRGASTGTRILSKSTIQANLDITHSMGPGKLVHHMQNLSYTYDEYLICIGLGPGISSLICKNPSYSGPSYPSSPVQLTLPMLRLLLSKVHACKDFCKPSKPYHVGIH